MYIQTAYEWIAAHEAEILDELHRFCAHPRI
jgi:hypothetical protein